jgi:hypothetical protein
MYIKRPASQQMEQNEVRTFLILIFIVALLGEHCNFDRLREEKPGAWFFGWLRLFFLFTVCLGLALAKDIDAISNVSAFIRCCEDTQADEDAGIDH